mmetsp:Transcript_16504/g.51204  ORF Transcript_16504/g.51204 Transcript_16504/m.51204 type:complete len:230 (-) Transcript_16504:815-1504(-)
MPTGVPETTARHLARRGNCWATRESRQKVHPASAAGLYPRGPSGRTPRPAGWAAKSRAEAAIAAAGRPAAGRGTTRGMSSSRPTRCRARPRRPMTPIAVQPSLPATSRCFRCQPPPRSRSATRMPTAARRPRAPSPPARPGCRARRAAEAALPAAVRRLAGALPVARLHPQGTVRRAAATAASSTTPPGSSPAGRSSSATRLGARRPARLLRHPPQPPARPEATTAVAC